MPSVLGDLSPAAFLRDYWQKRPLVVRQAIPGFAGILDRDQLLGLATRAEATSRLVLEHPRRRSRWERHDGPFGGLDAGMLPDRRWTLLVHGVESLVPGGWELLGRFGFIPMARIDDLMVSYAADGGGVGPHDDRYDVFLLQGPGRRRWRVMHRGDRSVDANAAIRVLSRFVADEEWLLEPGDMLYLPPGVAHWGVAEGPCFTYSIGFLAPSHQVLVESFLGYVAHELGPRIDPDALLRDTVTAPAKRPLALPDAMLAEVTSVLGAVRWDARMIEDFFGRFLTSPKARVAFARPSRPLDGDAFAGRLRARGRLVLALPSRGLVRGRRLYLNGASHDASRATLSLFEELLTTRALPLPRAVDARTAALLHGWYAAGWLQLAR
ncbi:MAG TPA: cupin domain-containing protein [Polyangia bacterium]|nr:cupin domain-containing protein [Polyangia bacterium]